MGELIFSLKKLKKMTKHKNKSQDSETHTIAAQEVQDLLGTAGEAPFSHKNKA